MNEREYAVPCEHCGERIAPDETDVVEAEHVVPMTGQGEGAWDTAPGMGALFHADCWPPYEGNPRYRRRDSP